MTDQVLSIDEAIESGDPDLIEKALELEESKGEQGVVSEEETEAAAEAAAEESSEDDNGSPADPEDEPEKVLMSKDGKHQIPYDVLEHERQQTKQLREQLEREQQARAELESKQAQNDQLLEGVKAKLEKQGMDVETFIAEQDEFSDEQWAEIEEDYGPLAKAMKALVQNQKNMAQRIASQPTVSTESAQPVQENPVVAAVKANADLNAWQSGDSDRWAYAQQVDAKLRQDPAWANKSLEERFAEAAKQTKSAFGDDVSIEDKAKAAIDKTKQTAPDSLSDIGSAPTKTKTTVEAMQDMSAEQIHAQLDGMSQDQLDSVFEHGFS